MIETATYLWTCGILLTIIFTLIAVLYGNIYNKQVKMCEEMQEIKDNYLDRFAKIYAAINKGNSEIKDQISSLHILLTEVQTTQKTTK